MKHKKRHEDEEIIIIQHEEMELDESEYVYIPNEVIDNKKLNGIEFIIFCFITMLLDKQEKVSQKIIIRRLNLKKKKVKKSIRNLKKIGYLFTEQISKHECKYTLKKFE